MTAEKKVIIDVNIVRKQDPSKHQGLSRENKARASKGYNIVRVTLNSGEMFQRVGHKYRESTMIVPNHC